MMQVSHSRVECFNHCKRKYQMRYLDKLKTIPDDAPDNALYLGTALHTGLEVGVEAAIEQYYGSYPIITDDHINEAIKLEAMIPKAKQMIPDGQHEVLIEDADFKGFIDLLVPVNTSLKKGMKSATNVLCMTVVIIAKADVVPMVNMIV